MRSPENTPAALALSNAVIGTSHLKARKGAHRLNLLSVIRKDLSRIPIDKFSEHEELHQKLTLKNQGDIDTLRRLAQNRGLWKRLFLYVV